MRSWTIDSLRGLFRGYVPLRMGDRYDQLQRLIINGRITNDKIILLRKEPYEFIKKTY